MRFLLVGSLGPHKGHRVIWASCSSVDEGPGVERSSRMGAELGLRAPSSSRAGWHPFIKQPLCVQPQTGLGPCPCDLSVPCSSSYNLQVVVSLVTWVRAPLVSARLSALPVSGEAQDS